MINQAQSLYCDVLLKNVAKLCENKISLEITLFLLEVSEILLKSEVSQFL